MIIVISYPSPIADEQTIIRQMFDEGLEIFHIRKKEYSEKEMREFVEQIPEKYFDRIVLHSQYHLAEAYNLKGVHVPVGFNGHHPNRTTSISFHSTDEIEMCDKEFEYGFLSPVFDSISKEGYKSKFDFSELKLFLKDRKLAHSAGAASRQLLALGGIEEDKVEKVKELGFSGIVLLGAIWQSENPLEKFKRIKEQWLKKELMY